MSPFFPGKPYVNRGISGQTTAQMLLRFYPDVIALKPKVVVFLAGTNDIARQSRTGDDGEHREQSGGDGGYRARQRDQSRARRR